MAAPTLTPTGIRTDLVARLIAANTAAGIKVYPSRRINLEPAELPALVVVSIGGHDAPFALTSAIFHRTERIAIVATVKGTDEELVCAARDTLAGQVKAALFCDSLWFNAFKWSALQGPVLEEKTEIDDSTTDLIGRSVIVLNLPFELTYESAGNDRGPLNELRASMGAEGAPATNPHLDVHIPTVEG